MNNMIKKSLLTATAVGILAAPAAFAAKANFEGPTIGIKAGVENLKSDGKANITDIAPATTNVEGKVRPSTTGFKGEVNAGYNFQFDKFVVGPEVGVSLSTGEAKKSQTASTPAGATVTGTDKIKKRFGSSLGVKAGYAVADDTLLYAKASVVNATFKHKVEGTKTAPFNETLSFKDSKNVWGFGFGAGVTHKVAQDVSVSAEIMHERFQTVKFKEHKDTAGVRYQAKHKPHTTSLMIGANYHL